MLLGPTTDATGFLADRVGQLDTATAFAAAVEAAAPTGPARLHFGYALDGKTEYYLRLACSGISTSHIVEGLGELKAFVDAGGPTGPQSNPEEKRP